MKRTIFILMTTLLLGLLLAGCSLGANIPDPNMTPPPPIPEQDQELSITGSSFMDVTDKSLVHINLTAIMDPDTQAAYTNLTKDNFIVVEDNVVQGFELNDITSSELKPKADLVFIIDATGSMGEEIAGVKNSVINFLDYLADQNLNLKVAGYAYADESLPSPQPFSSDYSTSSDFYAWVSSLSASGGGDWPENGLDPIAEALDELSWRRGAQKIFILLTDAPFQVEYDGNNTHTDWTVDTLYNQKLKGKAIVHSIGNAATSFTVDDPDNLPFGPYYDEFNNKDHEQYLSELTGGRWVQMPGDGNVDLTTTPIADMIAAGYLLTYQTQYREGTHDVRVIVTANDGKDGEYTEQVQYIYE